MANHEHVTDWKGWQEIVPKADVPDLQPPGPKVQRSITVLPGSDRVIVTDTLSQVDAIGNYYEQHPEQK